MDSVVLIDVVLYMGGFAIAILYWHGWVRDWIGHRTWNPEVNGYYVYKYAKWFRILVKICTTVLWPIMAIVTLVRIIVLIIRWIVED